MGVNWGGELVRQHCWPLLCRTVKNVVRVVLERNWTIVLRRVHGNTDNVAEGVASDDGENGWV